MKTMDYKEAAEFLHVTPGTLRNWVSAGKIKALKQPGKKGRVLFSLAELEEWLVLNACRQIKTDSFVLKSEKRLQFNVVLLPSKDSSSICAKIAELSPDMIEAEQASYLSLCPEELQAIGKAFLQAADDRKHKRPAA